MPTSPHVWIVVAVAFAASVRAGSNPAVAQPQGCAPAPTGMVAWYSGDLCGPEDLLESHSGSYLGFPICPLGPKVGSGAMAFLAAPPTYFTVPDDCELNPRSDGFSIDVWINTLAGGVAPIVEKLGPAGSAGGYSLSLQDGVPTFAVCDASICLPAVQGASPVNDGAWHLLAATLTRGGGASAQLDLYVDGALAASLAAPSLGPVENTDDLHVGAAPSHGPVTLVMTGLLDELEFFSRALSASEIAALYAADAAGKCRNLCVPTADCAFADENVAFGGIDDAFSGGAEPAVAGAELAALCAGGVNFDVLGSNQSICHTFSGLPSNIAAATLQVRLRAASNGACDDSLALQVIGPGFVWDRRIGTGGDPQFQCDDTAGLLGCPWTPGRTRTICLDLAALPNADGTTTNLLAYVNATRQLDVRVEDDTGVDYARLWYTMCPPCVNPPPNMAAWWPLDETSGRVAYDIAGGNDGVYVNDPEPTAGVVGGALRFLPCDFVNAGSSFNMPLGGFSYDYWFRWFPGNLQSCPNDLPIFGIARGIIHKGYHQASDHWHSVAQPGNGASQHPDYAGLVDDLHPNHLFSPAATDVHHSTWAHVAVTRENGIFPNGTKMYVNGVLAKQQTSVAYSFAGNVEPFLIGHHLIGEVDEVEVFHGVLSAADIAAICNAGPAGKCKHSCRAAYDRFCAGETEIAVPVELCNYSSSPQTYFLHFEGLPAAPATPCSGPPVTSFLLFGGDHVTVPAQTCIQVSLLLGRPAGLLPGQQACYRVSAANLATGQTTEQTSTVGRSSKWCVHLLSSTPPMPPHSTAPISFVVTNTEDPSGVLALSIAAAPSGGSMGGAPVSLNGLQPGTPLELEVSVPLGQSTTLTVDVQFESHAAFQPIDLVLSADEDDDGVPEPLCAAPLRSVYRRPWSDGFDTYPTGGEMHGVGGWRGWDGDPAAGALVSNAQVRSAPNSVAIVGASDLVQALDDSTSTGWDCAMWMFVPFDFQSNCDGAGHCGSYVVLLNRYAEGGPNNWSVQLHADSITNQFIRDGQSPAALPLVRGRWVELMIRIDLLHNRFRVFYDGQPLGEAASWTDDLLGDPGGAPPELRLAALDLFANGSSVVFYDEVRLSPYEVPTYRPGDVNCDGVIDFFDIDAFILALFDPVDYAATYPDCDVSNADLTQDGAVDFFDIDAFIACLFGACP